MEDKADVFISSSRLARLDLVAAAGGDPLRAPPMGAAVGGRWETQSWTRRETRGLSCRFCVLRDWALVVMRMVGPVSLYWGMKV